MGLGVALSGLSQWGSRVSYGSFGSLLLMGFLFLGGFTGLRMLDGMSRSYACLNFGWIFWPRGSCSFCLFFSLFVFRIVDGDHVQTLRGSLWKAQPK